MSLLSKVLLFLTVLCLVFVFGFKLALSGWMPFMEFGLGFAALFFVASIVIDYKFYKNFFRSESLHFVGQSFAFIIVTAVFLVALNYFTYTNNQIFDLTENKVNSLSELTMKVVDDIPGDFYFKYFYADSGQVKGYETIVKSKLARYQELNPKIHVESVSVYEDPAQAKKFKVNNEESALFAVFNDRIHRISELTEKTLTNAILKLTKDPKKIYFLQGHGERGLADETSFGLSRFKKEMERLHYELVPLDSLDIPKDAAFLAIVGPRLSFSDEERALLRDYVLSGGSLLMAIDPGESHGLANLTKSFGVEFQNAFTFDNSTQAGQLDLTVFVNPAKGNHELSRIVNSQKRPLFFMASPLKVYASDFSKMSVTPILSFSPSSTSHRSMEASSPRVSQWTELAAILTEAKLNTGQYFRVFVVGDSDFLSNQFFAQHANFDFSLGLISYLSKDEELMKYKARKPKTTYLLVTQAQMNIYYLFFVLPFIALFFIVSIFLKLRRLF
ncbi:MAG: Gldg family protein [Bdellovibrionales bacterium]|nr:GldG family protein [Bdellovibrionales bacterium]NQZ18269.1 Gldg family protein [Bdellovibrionales bacterium]